MADGPARAVGNAIYLVVDDRHECAFSMTSRGAAEFAAAQINRVVREATERLERTNADLLAAAERGLSFIRHALEFFGWAAFPELEREVERTRDMIEAAVAKAKGETP